MKNKVNEKQPLFAGLIRDRIEERFAYQDPPDEGDVKIIAAKKHASILEQPKNQQESQMIVSDSLQPEKQISNSNSDRKNSVRVQYFVAKF